jgi:hypothetical protein
MTLAVPIIPEYAAEEGDILPFFRKANPPWACNFVFITSRGHVTIPDAMPAPAPHKGVIYAAGTCVERI